MLYAKIRFPPPKCASRHRMILHAKTRFGSLDADKRSLVCVEQPRPPVIDALLDEVVNKTHALFCAFVGLKARTQL